MHQYIEPDLQWGKKVLEFLSNFEVELSGHAILRLSYVVTLGFNKTTQSAS